MAKFRAKHGLGWDEFGQIKLFNLFNFQWVGCFYQPTF